MKLWRTPTRTFEQPTNRWSKVRSNEFKDMKLATNNEDDRNVWKKTPSKSYDAKRKILKSCYFWFNIEPLCFSPQPLLHPSPFRRYYLIILYSSYAKVLPNYTQQSNSYVQPPEPCRYDLASGTGIFF